MGENEKKGGQTTAQGKRLSYRKRNDSNDRCYTGKSNVLLAARLSSPSGTTITGSWQAADKHGPQHVPEKDKPWASFRPLGCSEVQVGVGNMLRRKRDIAACVR